MKHLLIVFALILLSACTAKIDGKNASTTKASIDKLTNGWSNEDKRKFNQDIGFASSTLLNMSNDEKDKILFNMDAINQVIGKDLDGKSVEEIRSMAKVARISLHDRSIANQKKIIADLQIDLKNIDNIFDDLNKIAVIKYGVIELIDKGGYKIVELDVDLFNGSKFPLNINFKFNINDCSFEIKNTGSDESFVEPGQSVTLKTRSFSSKCINVLESSPKMPDFESDKIVVEVRNWEQDLAFDYARLLNYSVWPKNLSEFVPVKSSDGINNHELFVNKINEANATLIKMSGNLVQ